MKAFNINTPQVYRKIFGVDNVRSYRTDLQAVCGFLIANTKVFLLGNVSGTHCLER